MAVAHEMGSGINRDEWLKALEDAGEPTKSDEEAVTPTEFQAFYDPPISYRTAVRQLDLLVRKGLAVKTSKRALQGNGHWMWMIAYRLIGTADKRKKAV